MTSGDPRQGTSTHRYGGATEGSKRTGPQRKVRQRAAGLDTWCGSAEPEPKSIPTRLYTSLLGCTGRKNIEQAATSSHWAASDLLSTSDKTVPSVRRRVARRAQPDNAVPDVALTWIDPPLKAHTSDRYESASRSRMLCLLQAQMTQARPKTSAAGHVLIGSSAVGFSQPAPSSTTC